MLGPARSSLSCTQCAICLQSKPSLSSRSKRTVPFRRSLSFSSPRHDESPNNGAQSRPQKEEGALSRRLAEMTEESLLEGGRSARKNIQEAGFSDDLKRALEEKIKDASFKTENAQAFSVVNTPVSSESLCKTESMS